MFFKGRCKWAIFVCMWIGAKGLAAAFPTLEELEADLRKKYHSIVPFQATYRHLSDAMAAFSNVLALPEEEKSKLTWTLPGPHRRSGLGLVRREDTQGDYHDDKVFFHYHPWIKKSRGSGEDNPVLEYFLTQEDVIWNIVQGTMSLVLNELDQKYKGAYETVLGSDTPPHYFAVFTIRCTAVWKTFGKATF